MDIIALTGPIGCGKTTAAQFLCEGMGFKLVKFAWPLKSMLRTMGLTYQEVEGDLKEKPCTLLGGKTPRYAMQTLGTEWGRHLIGPDLWVNAWCKAIDGEDRIVVDDARFPNEIDTIRRLGGEIWRIKRPFNIMVSTHESEAYLNSIVPHLYVENYTDIPQFKRNLLKAYEQSE